MSTAVPSKTLHRPNTVPVSKGLLEWHWMVCHSTVGSKIIVALTGIILTGFVIGHLIGNLKLFLGRDDINAYAAFLKSLGPLLWLARGFLLMAFLVHITLAIRLKTRSAAARPIAYINPATIQASLASRTMLSTGIVVGLFLLLHLAHFTFGWFSLTPAYDLNTREIVRVNYLELQDLQGRRDVYTMVRAGFRNEYMAFLYVVAQVFLFIHLSHGVGSVFQTLGLNGPRFQRAIKALGYAVAAVAAGGNIGIVLAVQAGFVPEVQSYVASG